jgi:hypothetical protein
MCLPHELFDWGCREQHRKELFCCMLVLFVELSLIEVIGLVHVCVYHTNCLTGNVKNVCLIGFSFRSFFLYFFYFEFYYSVPFSVCSLFSLFSLTSLRQLCLCKIIFTWLGIS